MSPSKREREQARKRHQKRLERAERAKRAVRRRQIVAAVVVAAMMLAGAVALVLGAGGTGSSQAVPGSTDTPGQTGAASSTSSPGPLPTTNPKSYPAPPPATDALGTDWQIVVQTNRGDISVTLDGADAPQAVASFLMLADDDFFAGTACHRLLPQSLLQCGDPTGTGSGGPGYSFGPVENEPEDGQYPAGTIAMARTPNDGESMGSQFFLVFSDTTLPSDSAGGYTVFGNITSGLDVLKQIAQAGTSDGSSDGRPADNVIIESVDIK